MKFLHTADWQIAMRAGSVGEAGKRVRQQRLRSAERVVQVAGERKVDFMLVAGDTFEDNGVERLVVQKVGDILSSFSGPVYIIPGNHDPAVPGSVWEHPVWASHSNLHVTTNNEPLSIDGGVIYPCPLLAKHSSSDPTTWIPADEGEGIRIGLVHGTVEGIVQDEPDYPIVREAPERYELDYVALGHWHSVATYEGADGVSRMAYSGTHESTKFGERDSGNVLVVEIAGHGEAPVIESVRTGGLTWVSLERELAGGITLSGLIDEIDALENTDSTLVEIDISGMLSAAESGDVARIEEMISSRFLFGRVDASQLIPSPEDDEWLSAMPVGVVRNTAERLSQTVRAGASESETAYRALLELYRLAMEGVR